MSIATRIRDGEGTGIEAGVTKSHALKTTSTFLRFRDLLPEEWVATKVFNELLRNSSNSGDLNVDGSVTPVEFELTSDDNLMLNIHRIRLLMQDAKCHLPSDGNRFGDGNPTGLANGLELFVEQGGLRTDFFFEPVQLLIDLLSYATDYTSFANVYGANDDYLSVDFDLFAPITLVPSSKDRIAARVSDDLSGFVQFNVICMGTQEVLDTPTTT